MATTIPVPIEFSLPDGWRSVPPDEAGAPEAAFVALHSPPQDGFTANITLSGRVIGAGVPLEQLADEAAERLRRRAVALKVGRSEVSGDSENPGFAQVLQVRVKAGERLRDLVQLHTFIGMRDLRDPTSQAVLHTVLTTAPEQFADIVGDYQEFLSSIRPESGGAPGPRGMNR